MLFILFLINSPIAQDTINQLDSLGKQTSYWIITGDIYKRKGYADTAILEEGNYLNGRKVGDWIKYWPNGSLKQEAFYKNGRPNGFIITYHKNGRINEKGTWTRNHYINEFNAFYNSGCLRLYQHHYADSTYSEYYFDDCDTTTSLKGNLELSYSSYPGYEDKYINKEERLYYKSNKKISAPYFIEPYGHRTYNSDKQILMDGEFKNGHLWTRRHYIYNEQGLLDHIKVYKKGKYVGNGVL